MHKSVIKCGDIFLTDFGEGSIGHEYRKRRPAVVIQSNKQIKRCNMVTILPFSSNLRNKLEEDILVPKNEMDLLMDDSLIKVHHIMSFDYQRIQFKIGEVSDEILQKIKHYLQRHFDI